MDDLYLIYGDDDSDNGKFTDKDIADYQDPEFNILFGRRWLDSSKYKYPVWVMRDEDDVCIGIFGVKKE